MVDYRSPKAAAHGNSSPPIWVTTVGENGEFIPLAYFTEYTDRDSFLVRIVSANSDTTAHADSPFGRSFFYLLVSIVVVLGFGAWKTFRLDQETAVVTSGPDRWCLPGKKAQYVILAGIGGVLATLPIVLATGAAQRGEDDWVRPSLYWISLTILALVTGSTFVYVVLQARLTRNWVETADAAVPTYAVLAPWQVVAFALLISGVVFGWLLADHARLPDTACILFAERAANLYSGCSPVVPATVIGIGFVVYGLLGLQQVRQTVRFRVVPPYPAVKQNPPDQTTGHGIGDAISRVHTAVATIDALFANLAGTFVTFGTRTGTRWLRLMIWIVAGLFAVRAIYLATQGGPGERLDLWAAGIAVALVSVVLCSGMLVFAWSQGGECRWAGPDRVPGYS
jgi:hypothetical protein